MNTQKLALNGLMHAVGIVVYIFLVSLLLRNGSYLLGSNPSIFNIITMLCLLVLSATIVGTLLLGRPMMWYFNGAKAEAVRLFFYSMIWLLVFTVMFLILMATVLQ